MARPGEQPNFAALTAGPLGLLFLRLIRDLLGGDLAWQRCESEPAPPRVFRLRGTRAAGRLTEASRVEGAVRVYEWTFRGDLEEVPTVLVSEYVGYRWEPDPTPADAAEGDLSDSAPAGLSADRYPSVTGVSDRDRLTIRFVPSAEVESLFDNRPLDDVSGAGHLTNRRCGGE